MNFEGIRTIICHRAYDMAPTRMGYLEARMLLDSLMEIHQPGFAAREMRRLYFDQFVSEQYGRVVNASIEFVRFGILEPERRKGVSTEFANSFILKRYLDERGIQFIYRCEKKRVVLQYANQLTDWTIGKASGVSRLPIPPVHTDQGMIESSRCRDMIYISPRDMVNCVIFSEIDIEYSNMLMCLDDWIEEGYLRASTKHYSF